MAKEQLIKQSQFLLDDYADGNDDYEQMLEDAMNIIAEFMKLA